MITNGKVVGLSYTLKNEEGEELDRTDEGEAFHYLHGQGQIVPGLEKALEGLKPGDKKTIVVTPQDAYGEVVPDLVMTVGRDQFPSGVDIQEGMEFSSDVGGGRMIRFVVTGVEGDKIHLDGNHPLAGMTLNFSVEIQSIREATKEELEHGHAHGPGGHHH